MASAKRPDQGGRESAATGEHVYEGLRAQILSLDPAEADLARAPEHPLLWGAVMDMGYPQGTATLVALADGSTSLYTSTGGGIIGGGFHPQVAAATRSFLAALEHHLPLLGPDPHATLPAEHVVIIRALTYNGRLAAAAAEDDLGHGRHPLSHVFHAAHAVITELRLIDETSHRPRP